MLAAIVYNSIRYRGVVIALCGLIVIYGAYQLARAGLDIFPEFSPKQVIIQTEAPGLSAEQVELLVTQPVENGLSGLIGLARIRSESIQGLSVITCTFNDDTDVYRDRQVVNQRLAGIADRLPEGVKRPLPVPLSSSSATIMTIGVKSAHHNLMELRSIVDKFLTPRLMASPGVADINVFGGEIRQLQIQLLTGELKRFGIGVTDVAQVAREATGLRGAGFLENSNQRFTIDLTGTPVTPAQLRKVVLKRENGINVTLGDVATIEFAAKPPIGAASINGRAGIVMMVIGQYGANTLTVTRNVERTLEQFKTLFVQRDIDLHANLFRPADYIESSIANLSGHLLIGGLLVILILYVFLYNFRTALISALAIPVSLISAVIVLLETGTNLNIIVLGGLAIALGEVVDDAIIDTENIFRRLRENQRLTAPRKINRVIFNASMEVRGSVVYASFIVALVFVPLLTLDGVAGRLFAPLGVSYILAILASLAVALTLTPALCCVLLERGHLPQREAPLIRSLQGIYSRILGLTIDRARTAVVFTVAICVIATMTISSLGWQFLPELREGHYIIHTTSLPGTSLQESMRIGGHITRRFMRVPGVESVSQWAGRAERGADTYGSHYSEFEVRLAALPGAEQHSVLEHLRAILAGTPGIVYEANTFLIERVDETISGYTSPVVVNLYGTDLEALDAEAREIAGIIRSIPGATEVQIRSPPATPTMQIRLRLDQLSVWGLRPAHAIETIETAFKGMIIGETSDSNSVFEIAVVGHPDLRKQPGAIGLLPLRTLDGALIELSQVADIRQMNGRYNILRESGQRVQTITCNIEDRDYDWFVAKLKHRVMAEIDTQKTVFPEFAGSAIEQAETRQRLLLHSLIASALVIVLLYIATGSAWHALLTLVNVPFSLVGGVFAAQLSGGNLSMGSMVGFVTLFGITVRNAIMLIAHYAHLIENDAARWNRDTALRGAKERLPSILMTALVTALAMLPIGFDSDNPGREIMGPMAKIIIGGLTTSTLLNLIVLPALLLRYGRFAPPENTS